MTRKGEMDGELGRPEQTTRVHAAGLVAGSPDLTPRGPTERTPRRLASSVRRTSSLDVLRPDGFNGPVRFVGRARDLLTAPDGRTSVRAKALLAVHADGLTSGVIEHLTAEPPNAGLPVLVGASVSRGFRSRVRAALEPAVDSLLERLLIELPIGLYLGGFALHHAGVPAASDLDYAASVGVCAGWRTGGSAHRSLEHDDGFPLLPAPLAPLLESDDDPEAWHPMPPLPAHGIRRQRRLDVRHGRALAVDAWFRDTYMTTDGTTIVIHEYELRADVDPVTFIASNVTAIPRVLPLIECPEAAPSVRLAEGISVHTLRPLIAHEFRGAQACTHLNDLLATLGDVPELHATLAGRP